MRMEKQTPVLEKEKKHHMCCASWFHTNYERRFCEILLKVVFVSFVLQLLPLIPRFVHTLNWEPESAYYMDTVYPEVVKI